MRFQRVQPLHPLFQVEAGEAHLDAFGAVVFFAGRRAEGLDAPGQGQAVGLLVDEAEQGAVFRRGRRVRLGQPGVVVGQKLHGKMALPGAFGA